MSQSLSQVISLVLLHPRSTKGRHFPNTPPLNFFFLQLCSLVRSSNTVALFAGNAKALFFQGSISSACFSLNLGPCPVPKGHYFKCKSPSSPSLSWLFPMTHQLLPFTSRPRALLLSPWTHPLPFSDPLPTIHQSGPKFYPQSIPKRHLSPRPLPLPNQPRDECVLLPPVLSFPLQSRTQIFLNQRCDPNTWLKIPNG